MDIILNDFSLTGQYSSPEDFSRDGLINVVMQLKTADSLSGVVVLKNYAFYNSQITPDLTFIEILKKPEFARINDTIRRYKSLIFKCLDSPFWEDTKKHDSTTLYESDGRKVTDTCFAEACERDKMLFSFLPSNYDKPIISVLKEKETNINLNNFTYSEDFIDYIYKNKFIDFENYIILKFPCSKLEFSIIVNKKNNCLKDIPIGDQSEFTESFRTFSELEWTAIGAHSGLRFKPYTINRSNRAYFIGYEKLSIFEFRVSGKFRCFGYKEGAKFYITLIDLEHRLGDI